MMNKNLSEMTYEELMSVYMERIRDARDAAATVADFMSDRRFIDDEMAPLIAAAAEKERR